MLNFDDGKEKCGSGVRCIKLTRDVSRTGEVECYSPARIAVCRLLAIAKKCKGRRRERVHVHTPEKEEEEEVGVVCSELPERMSDDHRRNGDVSEIPRQEMTFNVAAGLGLLSLIAASKTELDKTMELRKQMEVFLRNVKEDPESKGTSPIRSDPDIAYAVSTTVDGLSNVSPYSQEDHAPALSQPESGISLVCDKHCDMYETEDSVNGTNHLEAELVAELERLQLDIGTEEYTENGELSENQEEVTEISSTDNATRTDSVSSGEVIDPQNATSPEFCGVPPLELERRLHEVLESRQEERIKELEAHLDSMKKKLQEKEVEVTWWKDTAKLISKQVPGTSRLLR